MIDLTCGSVVNEWGDGLAPECMDCETVENLSI